MSTAFRARGRLERKPLLTGVTDLVVARDEASVNAGKQMLRHDQALGGLEDDFGQDGQ